MARDLLYDMEISGRKGGCGELLIETRSGSGAGWHLAFKLSIVVVLCRYRPTCVRLNLGAATVTCTWKDA